MVHPLFFTFGADSNSNLLLCVCCVLLSVECREFSSFATGCCCAVSIARFAGASHVMSMVMSMTRAWRRRPAAATDQPQPASKGLGIPTAVERPPRGLLGLEQDDSRGRGRPDLGLEQQYGSRKHTFDVPWQC
jgi:hypothetical protein